MNRPDEVSRIAAASLIATALMDWPKMRQEAIAFVARVPAEAWVDAAHRQIAGGLTELHRAGRGFEIPDIWSAVRDYGPEREVGIMISTAVDGTEITYNPERRFLEIVTAYARAELGRRCESGARLTADPTVEAAELRIIMAELLGGVDIPDAAGLKWTDTRNWRDIARQPVPWVFRNAIPDKCTTLIASQGGLGKSTLARGLALSAILGRAIFPAFQPERAMSTMVLSGEDSEVLYLRGVEAYGRVHQIPDADLDYAVTTRLVLRALDPIPFLSINTKGVLQIAPHVNVLIREAKERRIGLIVVDTLRKHFGGVNENDNVALGMFMEACSAIAHDVDCGVIVLSHTNKLSANDPSARQTDVRGGSAAVDESRCTWILKRLKTGLQLTNVKQSYGPGRKEVRVEFCDGALREQTNWMPVKEEGRNANDDIPF